MTAVIICPVLWFLPLASASLGRMLPASGGSWMSLRPNGWGRGYQEEPSERDSCLFLLQGDLGLLFRGWSQGGIGKGWGEGERFGHYWREGHMDI